MSHSVRCHFNKLWTTSFFVDFLKHLHKQKSQNFIVSLKENGLDESYKNITLDEKVILHSETAKWLSKWLCLWRGGGKVCIHSYRLCSSLSHLSTAISGWLIKIFYYRRCLRFIETKSALEEMFSHLKTTNVFSSYFHSVNFNWKIKTFKLN